jgi:hypothetical protein
LQADPPVTIAAMADGALREEIEAANRAWEPFGPTDPSEKVTVPAGMVRRILLDRADRDADRGLLWLKNVRITGPLILEGCRVRPRILFEQCVFEEWVNFKQAELSNVQLIACQLEDFFVADQAEVRWNFVLERVKARDTVRLVAAKIKGSLSLRGATVGAGAKGSEEEEESEVSVNADLVEVAAGCFFSELTTIGKVRMVGAQVRGRLEMEGAKIEGGLVLTGAKVDAECLLSASRLGRGVREGLQADGLAVSGDTICDEIVVDGGIRMVGAKFAGSLALRGAELNGGGDADGPLPAFRGDRMEVADVVDCDGLRTVGVVRLVGASFGASLSMDGASLEGRKGAEDGVAVLVADGIEVDADLRCGSGFRALGEVYLDGAEVGGQLSLLGATLESGQEGGTALSMTGSRVGELILGLDKVVGAVDLELATVRSLWDAFSGEFIGELPEHLCLNGFRYESLREPLDARARLEWLALSEHDGFYPGIYVQLADAFGRIGHPDAARQVAIARERRAMGQLKRWRPRWLWRELLWVTTGAGYRNWLAGLWLLGLIAAGSVLFWRADDMFSAVALRPPAFNPVLYAVDVTVPVLDVGQQNAWTATDWLRWAVLSLTVAGYVLATALIAAAAGLLERDRR